MGKEKFVVLFIFITLFLGACMPSAKPVADGEIIISPSVMAVVVTETAVINSPISTYPYSPPQLTLTSPYPGLPPQGSVPTRPRATSTPPITAILIDDCTLHPSFSRCGGTQLTGKLAYLQTNDDLTVLDLDAETAWISTQTDLKIVDWSPVGHLLLVHNKEHYSFFYQPDGTLYDFDDSPRAWASTGSHQRNSYLWDEDHLTSVSIIRPETEIIESNVLNTERMARFDFHDRAGRVYWSVEDSEFYQEIITLFDWVPQTEWILLGYGNGGMTTRMATGYRLKALNARTGEIIDSGLSVPADFHFDWHPSEAGLLVTTDLHGSDMSGAGTLALWQILNNEITYPLVAAHSAYTPVWSPDGRYIAYGNLDPYEHVQQLMVLDMETGIPEMRAEIGMWPAWSRNGAEIFYLEPESDENPALVRAVGWEQEEPLTIAVSQSRSYPETRLSQTAFDYTP